MTPDPFHLCALAEFIRGVGLAGGTTPHMLMTLESMRRAPSREEALWRAGCYALVYNWPTAEVLWRHFSAEDTAAPGFEARFLVWARAHWGAGLALRKERKAVRSPEKLARAAGSYAEYLHKELSGPWRNRIDSEEGSPYDAAYESFCGSFYGAGRYIAIRWLELMARYEGMAGLRMPDMRPAEGSHPRKALALVYPDQAPDLLGGDTPRELAVAHAVAAQCLRDLATHYAVVTDYYELQSLLCEYKQSWLASKQYPGKSIDTEVNYWDRVHSYWGETFAAGSEFWAVRQARFPEWSLGECQGWRGVRPKLGGVLREHGYTWSDFTYDYGATTDFARPARRAGGREALL